MKILKRGKIPAPKIFQGKCENCETEAEWTENELENKTLWPHSEGRYTNIRCPLCSHFMMIREKFDAARDT